MKKILDGIEKFCLISMSCLLVAVIGVLFYQVVSRYLFSTSSIWIEEFARYGNVWITMILFCIVIRKNDSVRVDIIEHIFSKNKKFLKANKIIVVLAEMTFSIILFKATMELLPAAKNRIVPGLGISMYFIYLSFAFGSALSVIYLVEKLIKSFCPSLESEEN